MGSMFDRLPVGDHASQTLKRSGVDVQFTPYEEREDLEGEEGITWSSRGGIQRGATGTMVMNGKAGGYTVPRWQFKLIAVLVGWPEEHHARAIAFGTRGGESAIRAMFATLALGGLTAFADLIGVPKDDPNRVYWRRADVNAAQPVRDLDPDS